jgi:cell wall-associated NlpC family hydrolase
MLSEIEQRQKVIEVARSWLGTPYHHMGRVKSAGVDCATFVCEVYEEAGITPHIVLDYYPKDWALHKNKERYLETVLKYSRIISKPEIGDMILYRFGRVASHSAIVIEYPKIIHCALRIGVLEDFEGSPRAPIQRRVGFFSPWGKE